MVIYPTNLKRVNLLEWKPTKQSHQTIHDQIVNWVTERIICGDFPAGMKCLSQRTLAIRFDVNRSTINTAFEELKANGLIETRVGAGTFITQSPWPHLLSQPKWQKHINASIHKPNIETIQLINEYEQRDDMIRLGTGELSLDLLPTKQLEMSLQEIKLTPKAMGYSEPQGSYKLRESLCIHLRKRGIQTNPENILIISGALQAFQLIALGLLEPGSLIFQTKASYLNSIRPFQSAGMHMYGVDISNSIDDLLKQIKQNRNGLFYAIPTLENPTGRIWTAEEKRAVYNACKQLSIPILEDDVYGELLFDEDALPIKSFDESGHVLYVGSVSKTISPGLRIGWIVGPQKVINRLADIKMQTDYGSSSLSQAVLTHWLTSGIYENEIINLKSTLKIRAAFMEQLLETYFNDIATWHTPKGSFYIWIKFSKPVITKKLFDSLLTQKIILHPGYVYYPNDFHHLRLSYAYPSFEQMEHGIQLLASKIQENS